MIVAVATIVRVFELESLVESPKLEVGVSLLPAGGLPCRPTIRSDLDQLTED